MQARPDRPTVVLSLTSLVAVIGLSGCVLVLGNSIEPGDGDYSSHRDAKSAFDVGGGGKKYVGSGHRAKEERLLDDFHSIVVESALDVEIEAGAEHSSIVLSGDDNLLEHVETGVEDGVLSIALREGTYRMRKGLSARIQTPALASVRVAGSGDIEVRGIEGPSFEVGIAGSGDVYLSGRADEVRVEIAGSGDVDADDLRAARGVVRITGSGDVDVHSSEELDVEIRGSGDVVYSGNPSVRQKIAGSGSVERD